MLAKQQESTDIFTQDKRSEIMSRIKGKNSRLEVLIRSLLHRKGYRFRLHRKDLPGNPDIVLPKYHTVVFVHGCFWHQHEGCKAGRLPRSNVDFWSKKLGRNKERDNVNIRLLEEQGWKVVVLWECEIEKDLKSVETLLAEALNNE